MERKSPVRRRRLSGVDAAFLYLESEQLPLGIAGLFVFDGPIPFGKFVRLVDSRLDLVPKYRQIIVPSPLNLSYPTWEDDPHFDIRRHIFRVRLKPPGGEAELEGLAGEILSGVLDRRMPLWDMHVVEGLADGRGAVIVRMHHCLADGISGVALTAKLILDTSPEPLPPVRKRRARKPPKPLPKPSLERAIANGIRSSLEHLIAAEAGILEIAKAFAGDGNLVKEVASLLPEVIGAVERLPFNKPCRGERKFCWAEFDLSELQAIRAAAGGSVNDVILTVLTRALARYVELHGQSVVNRLIRVVCPVNLRSDNGDAPGNQISFMPVALPMDVQDPVRMLQAVAARTAAMKKARAADVLAVVANCLGIALPPVQAALWRGISNVMLPLPLFNIICTNIPGSPVPLYCLGRRLVAFYPQVPTGYELGVNVAALSYCGKLFFGLIADAQVAGDVNRLRDFLYPAFEELCTATGVRRAAPPAPAAHSPRKRRARRADRKAPAAAGPAAAPRASSAAAGT